MLKERGTARAREGGGGVPKDPVCIKDCREVLMDDPICKVKSGSLVAHRRVE